MDRPEMSDFTKELYIRLYRQSPIAVDSLPYTDHLDWITRIVQHVTDDNIETREVFRNLVGLRKDRSLDLKGKRGRSPSPVGHLEDSDVALIDELYSEQPLVSDKLPYTEQFDRMFAEFHRRSGTTMSRALFFCAVMNIRKKGLLTRKHKMLSREAAHA